MKDAISKSFFHMLLLLLVLTVTNDSLNTQFIYNYRVRSTVTIVSTVVENGKMLEASGSGSIIRDDGLILTAHHVVDNTKGIVVYTSDDKKYKAKVIAVYPGRDLAVLKLEGNVKGLNAITLAGSDTLQIGEKIMAVGFPFAVMTNVLSVGVVSKLVEKERLFLSDVAVNHGNSGGAAIDAYGRQVGVVIAMIAPADQNAGLNVITYLDVIIDDLKWGEYDK